MPLRTTAADRLVVGAAFLVVLLAASLVAAIPIYAGAVAESSLRARIARASVPDANVQLSVGVFGRGDDAGLDDRVDGLLRSTFGATRLTVYRSAESGPFRVGPRTVAFGFVDDLPHHARLLAGRWPSETSQPVEVAVPAAVAPELGVGVGDVVQAQSRAGAGRVVTARVAGIYEAQDPSSAFWWGEPLSTGALGPLVATREAFATLGLDDRSLRWRVEPDTSGLTIDDAGRLRRALNELPSRLNAGRPAGEQFDVQTSLPAVLAEADHALHLARAGVLVPFIQLALLAAYGLVVTTALLLERRYRVTETLRLRGATTLQITMLAVLEAALVALPAVLLAPWAAAGSLRVLNHVGPLSGIGLRLEPHVTGAAYALAAAAGLVCVLGLALPTLRARHVSVARERGRPALAGLAQRAHLDLVLAGLALLGYWQLRRYHGTLVSHQGSLGIDPFLVAAPAVLLLAGAVLALRAVPFGAGLLERLAATSPSAVSALGFRQLARRPRAYSRSVLLLVLAVATGVFATTYASTWRRSQVDQALHTSGADLRVEPSGVPGAPATIDLASSYAAIGASEALPAASDTFSIGGSGAQTAVLLALDARRAAHVMQVRNDFASEPLRTLLRPLDERRARLAAVPLPGRPTRLAVTTRLSLEHAGARDRPSLYLYLRDADGLLFLYRFDAVPGMLARHEIDLVSRLADGTLATPRYPLSVVGLELDAEAQYLAARKVTLDVRSFETAAGPDGPWRRVRLGDGWRGSAVPFDLAYVGPRVEHVAVSDGALRVTASTGSSADSTPRFGQNRVTAQLVVRPGPDEVPSVMPVLASDTFLAQTGAVLGDEIPLALSAGTQTVQIVGSFHRFPSLDPDTPAVVADLPTYLARVFDGEHAVVQPAEWWLRTADDRGTAERLGAAPFRSIAVVSRRANERALLDDPVAVGVIGALALGFAVAAIFAIAGFAANLAAEARTRRLEFAILRSLGLRRRQLTGLVTLETALVVVLSLVAGALLGLLVSRLVLPSVGLGAAGATPVPPVRLVVPWTTVLVLELALLAALAAIAVLQVEVVRRLRLAPVLRAGEGASAP